MDHWGDPTGRKYAATTAMNRTSPSARLQFSVDGAALRFDPLSLDGCRQLRGDRRVCSMSVRVGEDQRQFNVEEVDRWLLPGYQEHGLGGRGGSGRLLQAMVLRGLKRGDADVRVLLDFYGEGNTLFRFPLLGGCNALATLDLIHAEECGIGETAEPVTLAEWKQQARAGSRHAGLLPNVSFTYHEPTKLLSFWLLERWETAPGHLSRYEYLLGPTRHVWEEAASDDESRREFVPVRNNRERFIITNEGKALGRFDNTDDPEALKDIVTDLVAPNHMAIGVQP